MFVRILLAACLAAATALAAGPAAAQEGIAGGATTVSKPLDGCVRYVAQQATVVSCGLVQPRIMSDHDMLGAQPYDAAGNPIDRNGDVIAAPGDGHAQTREVFAGEERPRR
jgi:hypothetical protein